MHSHSHIPNLTITVDGPGTVEFLSGDDPEDYRYRLSSEGVYTFTATAVGPDGTTYTDTTHVTVLNRDELDALLKAKWEGMKSKLQNGDVDGALDYLTSTNRATSREEAKGTSYILLNAGGLQIFFRDLFLLMSPARSPHM